MGVVIVDTGCANLASVAFAYDRLGIANITTHDADRIRDADRIILPGVGSATFAMQKLHDRGLIDVLQNLAMPILGICLGMQLLFDTSNEGNVKGLGLLNGNISKLDTGDLPSPHMGWNTLENVQDTPLMNRVSNGDHVYFVHSYAAPISKITVSTATHGNDFSAVVQRGNIYGCQFHPERSGKTGAQILDNFARINT